MDSSIIEKLTRLTEEERDILRGQQVKQGDYSFSDRFIVNSAKLLEGRELDLRPHTRFVDFPEHGHDYMEFMYVYAGHISHVIGKETLTLERGDILFLNRHARHSVKRAGQEDIGINFILSNEFLQVIFQQVQNNPVMSEFLTNNFDDTGEEEYLLFRTKDCFPIRNLMDNLIYAIATAPRKSTRDSFPCSLLTLPIIGTRLQTRCVDLLPRQNCGAPFSPIWKNTIQMQRFRSLQTNSAMRPPISPAAFARLSEKPFRYCFRSNASLPQKSCCVQPLWGSRRSFMRSDMKIKATSTAYSPKLTA